MIEKRNKYRAAQTDFIVRAMNGERAELMHKPTSGTQLHKSRRPHSNRSETL